ncbi:MAG: ABC transporter substrate-binding protein, partial [Gammaproteobacteria bacterium]|nr:ABC transporter substrate-binding protein [Gammaproteobacteria bacterium]
MFDELLDAAIRSELLTTRQNFYQQAQEYLATEVPLLPIAHSVRFQASRDFIEGLELLPFGGIELRHARRLKPEHT